VAANQEVRITNNFTSTIFNFRAVSNFQIRKIQPPISIPLVNTLPASTFIFRFIGQSEEITFNFGLFDDGADVTSGSPGGINTVLEQINQLKNTIFSHEFDTDWNLRTDFYTPEGRIYNPVTGVITNLSLPLTQGSKEIVVGSLTFQIGNLVSL